MNSGKKIFGTGPRIETRKESSSELPDLGVETLIGCAESLADTIARGICSAITANARHDRNAISATYKVDLCPSALSEKRQNEQTTTTG